MPIRWPEPFGLVMTQAIACSTPVIAYPEGAAPEIVLDGETGFVFDSESEMADAIKRLDQIDPARCCESAAERFDVSAVVAAHERAYREVMTMSGSGAATEPPPSADAWRAARRAATLGARP